MKAIAFLIFALILTIGCDEESVISSDQFESETEESKVITLVEETNLIVENTNGSISVSTSDTARNVSCSIKKKVKSRISENDAQSSLSRINITYENISSSVKIKVNHPNNDDRNYEIGLNIILPDRFNYNLSLGNGTISIITQTRNLLISLGNGSVQTNVTLLDTCFASISVGNGELNLLVPENTNAMLSASIGNGVITNNGLNFQNQMITDKKFNGILGSGTGQIILSVGNGNITMNKK